MKKVVPSTEIPHGARRVRPALASGPAGGYTPAQLAKAYRVNAGAAVSQTVAIVDAFNDPSVRTDLNTFDVQYGLPGETTTTLKVVNQNGSTSPLPSSDPGWAGEITLDVQAVRGLCHKCRILLVEADSDSDDDLAAAVNRAVTMGAKIVSNSYGGPETDPSETAADRAAYNHPGVAILASSGDDGWYGWDVVNCASATCGGNNQLPDNVPSDPASLRTVIGVGGTSLYLNPDGTRASEQVWNSNGPGDVLGSALGLPAGAAGSGCSTLSTPQRWQQFVAHYSGLGCGASRRSGVDIASVADPFTGYDIFQTFGNTATGCPGTPAKCWETIGGTSLASPVVAALWVLAGGAGGVRYPALSLYGHFKSDAEHVYDVTVGGTGACDTLSPVSCTGGVNPNSPSRELDCAWNLSGSSDTPLANRYQCYARPGYDGVSGVGTPVGANVFVPMRPIAVIAPPGTVKHGVSHTFSASGSHSPFPGGSIVKYVWHWGDGHTTTTTNVKVSHTYATKGTKTVTLVVSDNYTSQNNGRTGKKTITITVQ